MNMEIFAIFDAKASAFMRPFFLQNEGIALRTFSDLVADPESEVAKHPEDYSLFKLGSYDDQDGVLKPINPKALSNGAALIPTKQYGKRLEA